MNAWIRDLQAKYDAVVKHLQGQNSIFNDGGFWETDLPFTKEVIEFPYPEKFKVPAIDPYDRSKDPANHVETYKTNKALQGPPDQIMCRVFQVTLVGSARRWFSCLKPNSIGSFVKLQRQF